MRLRYPELFRSTVDMDLRLVGSRDRPRLEGDINVLRVVFAGTADPGTGLMGLAGAGPATLPQAGTAAPSSAALALNIKVAAPRMRFIDTDDIRVDGSADLEVRGTFDAPLVTGRVDVLGGEVLFFGNRFYVGDGAIMFQSGSSELRFDLSAETRPRIEGQTFNVTVGLSGTFRELDVQLTSDPWLPTPDLMSIVFGGVPAVRAAEQRALQSSSELQQQMMQTVGAAFLTSVLTSRVGDVVEQTGVVDTVQITPVLSSQTSFQRQNPSARITLGRRISPRVFLTYSRTVGDREEEIILLEYDQNDRLSWVLSRNEDRTFALDFRLRYVF
jgi:autotransporter translocation and assembly factor TamB